MAPRGRRGTGGRPRRTPPSTRRRGSASTGSCARTAARSARWTAARPGVPVPAHRGRDARGGAHAGVRPDLRGRGRRVGGRVLPGRPGRRRGAVRAGPPARREPFRAAASCWGTSGRPGPSRPGARPSRAPTASCSAWRRARGATPRCSPPSCRRGALRPTPPTPPGSIWATARCGSTARAWWPPVTWTWRRSPPGGTASGRSSRRSRHAPAVGIGQDLGGGARRHLRAGAARRPAHHRPSSSRLKGLLDSVFTIPMVLPPTVCGFLLLLLFGQSTAVGRFLIDHGIALVFTLARRRGERRRGELPAHVPHRARRVRGAGRADARCGAAPSAGPRGASSAAS